MKDTFYFPHDYNAKQDQKIIMLRGEFGLEGYAIFFMLLESMAEDGNGVVIRGAIGGLSIIYGVAIARLNEIIKYCIGIGLFKEDEKGIFSERMMEHKKLRKELSEAGKDGASKRRGNRGANGEANGPPNAKERKGKEIKEKEKKENEGELEFDKSAYFQKSMAVETKGKFLVGERNKFTGRNDLMDDKTKKNFMNFIYEVDTNDFGKRVELYTRCLDLIQKHSLQKFLFYRIQNYAIGQFLENINQFVGTEKDVFSKIVQIDYITKVTRIISEKEEEPKKEEYSTPKPTSNPEELRKAQEEFRKKFGKK